MAMARRLSMRSVKDISDSCNRQSLSSLNSSTSLTVFSPNSSISSGFKTPMTPIGAVVFFPKSVSDQRRLSLTRESPLTRWMTPPQKPHRLEIPKAPMRRSIDVGELSRQPESEGNKANKQMSSAQRTGSYRDFRPRSVVSSTNSVAESLHGQTINATLFWSPVDDDSVF